MWSKLQQPPYPATRTLKDEPSSSRFLDQKTVSCQHPDEGWIKMNSNALFSITMKDK